MRRIALLLTVLAFGALVGLGPWVHPAVRAQNLPTEAAPAAAAQPADAAHAEMLRSLRPQELDDRLAAARTGGNNAEVALICSIILERNPSAGTVSFLHGYANAVVSLWVANRDSADLTIQAIRRWREILTPERNPEDMVAKVGEARVWAYVWQHVATFGQPQAFDALQQALGADERILLLLAESFRLRSYVVDHPGEILQAYVAEYQRQRQQMTAEQQQREAERSVDRLRADLASMVGGRFGTSDDTTQQVSNQGEVPEGAPPTEAVSNLRRLPNDEFRRAIQDRLEETARVGYPVVGAVQAWEEFAPFRDDVDFQVRLVRRTGEGGVAPLPKDPFRAPEAPVPGETTPTEILPPVVDTSEVDAEMAEIRRLFGSLQTIMASGQDVSHVEELSQISEQLALRIQRIRSSQAYERVVEELDRLQQQYNDLKTIIEQTILTTFSTRGDQLLNEMRQALQAEHFDEVDAKNNQLMALVQQMRAMNPQYGPRATELETQGRAIFQEKERIVVIRRILNDIEITGIIQGPDYDLVIVNGQVYRVGEELRNEQGETYEGLRITQVDALRRVLFTWGDQTFTATLKQPEWWIRYVEERTAESEGNSAGTGRQPAGGRPPRQPGGQQPPRQPPRQPPGRS